MIEPIANLSDGPLPPNAFAWAGRMHEGLRPQSWRLVDALWNARNRAASLDQLARPVFELADPPERHQYAPAASRANAFFRINALPFVIRSKNYHLQLISRPD
jgi:hypothetical protein